MFELIVSVSLVIIITALCSVFEAAFYSLPWSRIEQLRKANSPAGEQLFRLRQDVEKPITAILTLATVAHTAGASLAGVAAAEVFGHENLGLFAAAFTAAMLLLSEIIPKTLGVMYNRTLAPHIVGPLRVIVWLFSPVIWASGIVIRALGGKQRGPQATEDDIRAVVSLTRQAGLIKPDEELSIRNILSLDRKRVCDVMTPRTVVFSLPACLKVSDPEVKCGIWPHSRVPVYEDDDPEDVVGIVYRRQVLEALAQDKDDLRLADVMKPVRFILETVTLDKLLRKFLEARMHLFVVLDEYGGVAGVVSLEDVLEEILGSEIVDETDQVVDMRELARQQRERLIRLGRDEGVPSPSPLTGEPLDVKG